MKERSGRGLLFLMTLTQQTASPGGIRSGRPSIHGLLQWILRSSPITAFCWNGRRSSKEPTRGRSAVSGADTCLKATSPCRRLYVLYITLLSHDRIPHRPVLLGRFSARQLPSPSLSLPYRRHPLLPSLSMRQVKRYPLMVSRSKLLFLQQLGRALFFCRREQSRTRQRHKISNQTVATSGLGYPTRQCSLGCQGLSPSKTEILVIEIHQRKNDTKIHAAHWNNQVVNNS